MLRRLGHRLVLLALLLAIGVHWHVLQSVAWTTMLAENLRNASLTEAVARTFDGKHPCCLCKEIAKGKQAEKKSEFPSSIKKLDFLPAPLRGVSVARVSHPPATAKDAPLVSISFPPPSPPPRLVS